MDFMPPVLLLVFSISLGMGLTFFVLLTRRQPHFQRQAGFVVPTRKLKRLGTSFISSWMQRPECWLVIKSRSLLAVQSALGLHNVKPCRWAEGLAAEARLFISPPVDGWVLAVGSGIPDPTEDADACFRFVTEISRKLGQVQLFKASRLLNHHAWVQARSGKIVRAYAWAGRTVWQQGLRTAAEKELKLKCYDYFSCPEPDFFSLSDPLSSNVEKVPLLAARWSFDPGRLDESILGRENGIAGELSRRF